MTNDEARRRYVLRADTTTPPVYYTWLGDWTPNARRAYHFDSERAARRYMRDWQAEFPTSVVTVAEAIGLPKDDGGSVEVAS